MANPWLKNKRRNWRDNPTMMELYRRAMANKYSPYRRMDLEGQDTVFDYPSALWPQSETVVEEPAFVPPGRTPKRKEDVKTVITESDDPNVATKKVTTVMGGLLGEPDEGYPGAGFISGERDRSEILKARKQKFLEREAQELAQRQKMREQTGGAAPSQEDVAASLQRYGDVRRSQFTPPQVQPGTDFFGGDVTDPNTERAIILADRKRKFLEREAQELAARQKMREQTGGAAPTQAQIEESLGRYRDSVRGRLVKPTAPVDEQRVVDPRIVALNQPRGPARIPLAHGQDDPTGAAYEGRFETGSSDATIQGMIEDAKRQQRIKERAEAGVPARDEFSEFSPADEEKGILHYLLNPFEKPPATEWGDSAYADTMIEDQQEREAIAQKRLEETGSEHPTIRKRLGLTKEDFRWKGEEQFQKKQEEKEVEKQERVDMGLPERIAEAPDIIGELPTAPVKESDDAVEVSVAEADSRPGLWEAWGDFVRKPGERKAAYVKSLSDIFRKAMIMNAVAQLTGGTSQANAYVKFATGKLDAIEKFDQEDRLQSAWKSIMFNEDGVFNPPAGYSEALERAAKLGVSPKESKAFSALFPKASTSKFWVFDTKSKKNIRITDDQYIKDDGRYVATADAGGRATETAKTDIPYYANDPSLGLSAEEIEDVGNILLQPNAIMELWKKYPELMRLYKKKEDETSAASLYGLNALTAAAGRQQEGTQSRTPGIKIESVEDVP